MMLRPSGFQVKNSGRAVHSSARRGRAALAAVSASSGAPIASSATASCGTSSTRSATLLAARHSSRMANKAADLNVRMLTLFDV